MNRAKVTDTITIGRKGIKIPIVAILAAIPAAIKAAKESSADNRDESSPGGERVTSAEITEDVTVFFTKLTELVLPKIIKLNTKK